MAPSSNRLTKEREPGITSYPVYQSTTIYEGSMVALNSSGYLVPAADAAGNKVVGKADEMVDNASGASGAKYCRVKSGRQFLFAATSITQAMVGKAMYVVDDETFDDVGGTNYIKAGKLTEYVSATSGWIQIDGPQRAGSTFDNTLI